MKKRVGLKPWKSSIVLILMILLVSIPESGLWAEGQGDIQACARIEDNAERLRCYDLMAGRIPDKAIIQTANTENAPKKTPAADSYLAGLWEGPPAIRIHRSNYILPFTYNTAPNQEPVQHISPNIDVQKPEAVFQVSFKSRLWKNMLGKEMDLWFGYTQRSFWQVYNVDDSSPFRESNYEPELLLNFRTDFNVFGLTGRSVNVGINHQSNGRSTPLSRSWNRLVANVGFARDNFVLLLNTWYRIPESAADDDNPDIEDYLGNGELQGYYFWKGHRFGAMVRNNLNFSNNRGALELEWSFPLNEHINGYVQYFTGYGESLLDYDHNVNRFGFGFMLTDWK